ncbi:hypothetical protein RFI_07517 [Reticulomyxa filosa]|uniref:Uncharacterized protein n=1 Tax=Reticulomyxa filosa TaxID=46433 RepID=X6NUA1_RETFI|nr:hypothetical protein RFI_07517 [Reticulomyxa filosa]|eukprot:ETO29601.1 hypothetical protein RFI_07517 [Reticulomyxa filosa]
MQHEYESAVHVLENRLQTVEHATNSFKSLADCCHENSLSIDKLQEKQKTLVLKTKKAKLKENRKQVIVSISAVEHQMNELAQKFEALQKTVNQQKGNVSRIQKLEESQRNVCVQISSVESLLQCKVDRSSVPLIESCHKQLMVRRLLFLLTLLAFWIISFFFYRNWKHFEAKYRNFYLKTAILFQDVKYHCDLAVVPTAMQNQANATEWERKWLGKVDNEFLTEHVIKTLNELAQQVSGLMSEYSKMSMAECCDTLQRITARVEWCEKHTTIHHNKMDIILQQVTKYYRFLLIMLLLSQLEKKADRVFTEQLCEESKALCRNNSDLLQKNMVTIETELEQVQKASQVLCKQMAVVLKFVKWYSKIQLEC